MTIVVTIASWTLLVFSLLSVPVAHVKSRLSEGEIEFSFL